MIACTPVTDTNILEIALSGAVSREDYETVLIPAIDRALEDYDAIRALVLIAPGTDYTVGALKDDAWMGLKHWRGFERIAVVGKDGWIGKALKGVSIMMPCPVMLFEDGKRDEAMRWLQESLGAIHQTDLGDGVLHVQLMGKLDPSVYAEETEDLNAFIRRNERFRLLLDLRDFDGWQGLAGVTEHLKLVRDHHGLIDKAAIVGQRGWEKLAARIGGAMMGADTKYFAGDLEAAKAWIKA
ncbi:MAG: STAS/SEC14 domain-containing protein [Rhodobacteraceae bacterium]|nr:STAS/SEC14 domain-containing protein [Paracoccaceae bacterium]MAY45793.1 STAS/SEC14 domain-containing protein [Paracoccaceae bacterium]